jgi:hypothetical protein
MPQSQKNLGKKNDKGSKNPRAGAEVCGGTNAFNKVRKKGGKTNKKRKLVHWGIEVWKSKVYVQHPNPINSQNWRKKRRKEKERKPWNWGRDVQRTQFHNPIPIFPNQLSVHPATLETRQCTPLQYGGR